MLPAFPAGLAAVVFIIVGMLMLCVVLFLSWAVRPLRERPRSQETYECGFKAQGDARAIGFNYLQYAVLFLIFDIAALYLFLFAVLPQMPAIVTISFLIGIATLGLMILYGTKSRRYHVA
jgi:NADH:ubiquinone oxidoreductase subunit 3 (subunit A)